MTEEEDDTCEEEFSFENTLASYSVLNTVETGPNVCPENCFKSCLLIIYSYCLKVVI